MAGAYGDVGLPLFDSTVLSLLDRGLVYGHVGVRGGYVNPFPLCVFFAFLCVVLCETRTEAPKNGRGEFVSFLFCCFLITEGHCSCAVIVCTTHGTFSSQNVFARDTISAQICAILDLQIYRSTIIGSILRRKWAVTREGVLKFRAKINQIFFSFLT